MDHPADEVLARIADGSLSADGELAEHLRGCATCTDVLSALMRARTGGGLDDTARSPRGSDGAPKVHERIGRYRVERLLGEGAMGPFEMFKATVGPDGNQTVAVQSFIAGLDLKAGKAAEVIPVFERVQKIYTANGNQSVESALNHLKLAEALLATQGPKDRICAEAALSREQYTAAGGREKDLAVVEKVEKKSGCPPKGTP